MGRVLITGVSGTGKTAVVSGLRARGQLALDLDCAAYSEWVQVPDAAAAAPGSPVAPGRDWVWREDRVRELLAGLYETTLFVSGCASNMGAFRPAFDHVVLLSARPALIAARLRARPRDEYGSRPQEVERVMTLIETVEPVLRRSANVELDTGGRVEDAVAAILEIARCRHG